MQLTSKAAHKMIGMLKDKFQQIEMDEKESCCYTYSGGEKPLIYSYSFTDTQEQLHQIDDKVAKLRHAINLFNVSTEVPGYGFMIDEALVRLAMMNDEKNRIDRMRGVKARVRSTSPYTGQIEYTVRNYSEQEVSSAYDNIAKSISDLQQAIDLLNITALFEVEGI